LNATYSGKSKEYSTASYGLNDSNAQLVKPNNHPMWNEVHSNSLMHS